MERKKQLLRFAQYTSHALVIVNGNILCKLVYDPAAYPKMFPTAMKKEKNAFAVRVFLASPAAKSARNARQGPWRVLLATSRIQKPRAKNHMARTFFF